MVSESVPEPSNSSPPSYKKTTTNPPFPHGVISERRRRRPRTLQLQLALQLLVDLVLVELSVGRLKVKVLLELHRAVPAHVEPAAAPVASSAPAPVRGAAGRETRGVT